MIKTNGHELVLLFHHGNKSNYSSQAPMPIPSLKKVVAHLDLPRSPQSGEEVDTPGQVSQFVREASKNLSSLRESISHGYFLENKDFNQFQRRIPFYVGLDIGERYLGVTAYHRPSKLIRTQTISMASLRLPVMATSKN